MGVLAAGALVTGALSRVETFTLVWANATLAAASTLGMMIAVLATSSRSVDLIAIFGAIGFGCGVVWWLALALVFCAVMGRVARLLLAGLMRAVSGALGM